MSFLDKAKEKATQLTAQVKDKVDDAQNKRKADDLLDDIGRIIYRQRTTGVVAPDDETALAALVADLKALAEQGVDVLGDKAAAPATATLPPPAAPAAPDAQPAPMPMPEPGNG